MDVADICVYLKKLKIKNEKLKMKNGIRGADTLSLLFAAGVYKLHAVHHFHFYFLIFSFSFLIL